MILHLFFLVCMLGRPILAAAAPELAGFFVLSDKAYFLFVDAESDSASGWLSVGDSFEGWLVEEFQSARDTVVLKREGERVPVSLRAAIILEDRIAFSGQITIGAGKVLEVSRGTLRFGQEEVYPLAPGVTLHLRATRMNDGNIMYAGRFEVANDDGTIEKLSAPRVIARPGQGFGAQMGELSFALEP